MKYLLAFVLLQVACYYVNCDYDMAGAIAKAKQEVVTKDEAGLKQGITDSLNTITKLIDNAIAKYRANQPNGGLICTIETVLVPKWFLPNMRICQDKDGRGGLLVAAKVYESIKEYINTGVAKLYSTLETADPRLKKVTLMQTFVVARVLNGRAIYEEEQRNAAGEPKIIKSLPDITTDYKTEQKKVLDLLAWVIPELKKNNSNWWSSAHQEMLNWMNTNLQRLDAVLDKLADKTQNLARTVLTEDYKLILQVTDSRPQPGSK